MVAMLSHPFAPEQSWEAHVGWYLGFRYHIVATLRLADLELADLVIVSKAAQRIQHESLLTCNSVSVMVPRLTRA